jgi:hypothetical protein
MALPAPPAPVLTGPMNPVELFLSGFNTNTYFIGLMMLLLNLGGRHLAGGLTPEQDKLFQHPWIRRALLFVVIFVATRNIFTAIWMSIGIVLVVGYLTNETSSLYIFGKPKQTNQPAQPLSIDEQEIYRRLQERMNRAEAEKNAIKPSEGFNQVGNYQNTMRVIQGVTAPV